MASEWRDRSTPSGVVADLSLSVARGHVPKDHTTASRRRASDLSVAEVARIREDERHRIARSLHDDLGQVLAALRLDLAELTVPHDHSARQAIVRRLDSRLADAVESVRTLAFDLRRPAHPASDIAEALHVLTVWMTSTSGIPCRFVSDIGAHVVAGETVDAIRLIVCELLVNTAKHSQARWASVSVVGDGDALRITVCDDGVGILGSTGAGPRRGSGLAIVEERATELGGSVRIVPVQTGCRTVLTVPSRSHQAAEMVG